MAYVTLVLKVLGDGESVAQSELEHSLSKEKLSPSLPRCNLEHSLSKGKVNPFIATMPPENDQ